MRQAFFTPFIAVGFGLLINQSMFSAEFALAEVDTTVGAFRVYICSCFGVYVFLLSVGLFEPDARDFSSCLLSESRYVKD